MSDNLALDMYRVSIALISIVDTECCEYGFHKEVMIAEEYVRRFEIEVDDDQ